MNEIQTEKRRVSGIFAVRPNFSIIANTNASLRRSKTCAISITTHRAVAWALKKIFFFEPLKLSDYVYFYSEYFMIFLPWF